jgi:hypothetical protein
LSLYLGERMSIELDAVIDAAAHARFMRPSAQAGRGGQNDR